MIQTNNTTTIHNDEIDLKEVYRTILRYKLSIILITMIFLVGSGIFAYYKPNIYQSNSLIEILEDDSKVSSEDFMLKAFGGESANIDNDIAVIKSRFIFQKALESLNLSTNYYTTNFVGKPIELYKDSPFIVSSKIIEDITYKKTMQLLPIDENSFRLVIEPLSNFSLKTFLARLNIVPLKEVDQISYNKVHKYGEQISTAWFTFTVNKIGQMSHDKYSFNFTAKHMLYDKYIENLSISQVSKNASVLNMTFQDNIALRAKEILNATSMKYMQQSVDQKTQAAKLTLGFINRQLDAINTKLKSSESNLENFKEKNEMIALSSSASLASTKIVEYEAQMQELSTEINILTNLQHYIANNKNLSGLTIGTINFADRTLASLVTNLQTLTQTKENLLIDFTNLHPEVQKLTKNIATLRRSIITALKNSLGQLHQRKSDIKILIQKYEKSLQSLPGQEKELTRLSRHFNVNAKIYEYLLQKKAETAILKSSTLSNTRVLDEARQEWQPIKPKRKLIVLVGLILGLIVGIAWAFLREFLSYTITNAEEIERFTSLPIYGVIPLYEKKISKNILLEAYRNIRTNLQFLPGNEKNQIISITSSVSGEGKTTTTANLGKILAASNDKSVVVIDLDMRKSSLHKQFDIPNTVGISNYLTAQNSLDEIINHTKINNLDLITTGSLPPNPSELILSSMFTQLLDQLRDMYDYIIIDTPPAGLVTDAVIIMNYADISFALIKAEYSRKEFVKNIDRLAKDHSDNRIGIILNGTKIGSQYGYGYGASYAYGYGNNKYYQDRK